mmetsp:Transcript_87370/g.174511  ORF Transcript_87370/g.174511 Transcript_87370/m.174511 type:complete len:89 (+) Transcript_87370:122-388(+)
MMIDIIIVVYSLRSRRAVSIKESRLDHLFDGERECEDGICLEAIYDQGLRCARPSFWSRVLTGVTHRRSRGAVMIRAAASVDHTYTYI